jgi:hypothetical protein
LIDARIVDPGVEFAVITILQFESEQNAPPPAGRPGLKAEEQLFGFGKNRKLQILLDPSVSVIVTARPGEPKSESESARAREIIFK